MRGHPDIGNITNINAVQPCAGGFKGVLSFAGSGRRETGVHSTHDDAEHALNDLRRANGVSASTFN